MARKSNELDKKMIKAGTALLRTKGAAELSVREVAKKAGANLGMFNYYFGTKDNFIREILEQAYQPFLESLRAPGEEADSLEEALFRMACFSRDHDQIILALFADVLAREKNVVQFLAKNFTQHFEIFGGLLQAQMRLKGWPMAQFDQAFRFLISAVGIPNLVLGLRGRVSRQHSGDKDTDAMLRCRVRAALKGLPEIFHQVGEQSE